MLILTRRPGESIILELPTGERITVTVLGIKGNQVRICAEKGADSQRRTVRTWHNLI